MKYIFELAFVLALASCVIGFIKDVNATKFRNIIYIGEVDVCIYKKKDTQKIKVANFV